MIPPRPAEKIGGGLRTTFKGTGIKEGAGRAWSPSGADQLAGRLREAGCYYVTPNRLSADSFLLCLDKPMRIAPGGRYCVGPGSRVIAYEDEGRRRGASPTTPNNGACPAALCPAGTSKHAWAVARPHSAPGTVTVQRRPRGFDGPSAASRASGPGREIRLRLV